MITCTFEDGGSALLRHITVNVFIFNKKEDEMLLIKRSAKYSEPNKWGPAGGFMKRDESIEQAAMREVKEETGYTVRNIRLFRINDNPMRPKEDRQNVDCIYIANTDRQREDHDEEISSVQWFSISNLPQEQEFAFDHFENIQLCLLYIKQKFTLPIIGKIPGELTLLPKAL